VEKEIIESAIEDLEFDKDVTDEEKLFYELPEGIRLDVGLTDVMGKSRSFVQGLITQECVIVNGSPKKANYKVRQGDQVVVELPYSTRIYG